MRRLTVILMCAVCAVMNVVAQTVASSPTAVSARVFKIGIFSETKKCLF